MKKFLLLILLFPSLVSAHGGVSKNVGNAVLSLNQSPLSPLLGEKVKFTFTLTNQKLDRLPKLDVELVLTDTYFNDATKDQVVLTKQMQTDDKGNVEFEYSFNKTDFYDLELKFKDPVSGEMDQTGFLIQPRAIDKGKIWPLFFLSALAGFIIAVVGNKFRKSSIAPK